MFGNSRARGKLIDRAANNLLADLEAVRNQGDVELSQEHVEAVGEEFLAQLLPRDTVDGDVAYYAVLNLAAGQAGERAMVARSARDRDARARCDYWLSVVLWLEHLENGTDPGLPAAPTATFQAEASQPAPAQKPQTDATSTDKQLSVAMTHWLDRLEVNRPALSDGLTDELLAVVGPPPIPSRYRSDGIRALVEHAQVKAFGKLMAEHRSRQGWLAYGTAEKANDPAAMEAGHMQAKFWDYVARWLEQQR
jgi:hypothetical protein